MIKEHSKKYLLATLFLFAVEVAIAYFHFNPFIRGFLGDVLVILLMYSFLKIFIRNNVIKTAVSVLAFAFFVEFLQYFKLAELLNVQSKLLLILIGSVFDVWDLVAYSIGFLLILLIEKLFAKYENFKNISL
jgi:DNA integrity scanning protein DisA with diadenylate cyclase activity